MGIENLMACGSEISVFKSQGPSSSRACGCSGRVTDLLFPLILPVLLTSQGPSSKTSSQGHRRTLGSVLEMSIEKVLAFYLRTELLSEQRGLRKVGGRFRTLGGTSM